MGSPCALYTFGTIPKDLATTLLGGGSAVAFIGFLDDRRSVQPLPRLIAHFAAALWAVMWLGGFSALRIGNHIVSLGWGEMYS